MQNESTYKLQRKAVWYRRILIEELNLKLRNELMKLYSLFSHADGTLIRIESDIDQIWIRTEDRSGHGSGS